MISALANKIAPHEPPPVVSTSAGPAHQTLDSLPAPAHGGGRWPHRSPCTVHLWLRRVTSWCRLCFLLSC